MNRNEILLKLSNIGYRAYLTYLSSEYCYEIVEINNYGVSTYWDSEWHFYLFKNFEISKLNEIISMVKSSKLEIKDIENTPLITLYCEKNKHELELNEYFEDLSEIKIDDFDNRLYCMMVDFPKFFTNETELLLYLANIPMNTRWEDMKDNDLLYYLNLIEEDDDYSLPYLMEA